MSFVLMLMSAMVKSNNKENLCFDNLTPLALIETEEAFIISIYTLLVFRMVYIYSQISNPSEADRISHQCLTKTQRVQNVLVSVFFAVFSVSVWVHWYLVKFDFQHSPEQMVAWLIMNFVIFAISMLLLIIFLWLFNALRAQFQTEKRMQGPELFAEYKKIEILVVYYVAFLAVLFFVNIILYSVVKPLIFYKLLQKNTQKSQV
jgi:hypothetical protein